MRVYDPGLAQVIGDLPRIDWADPAGERARLGAMATEAGVAPDGASSVEVRDLEIAGPASEGVLALRTCTPVGAGGPRPGVLFLHGGGWVLGDLDSEHGAALDTAAAVGCVVVSPAYRLAPEHPFPAAVDDAWRALQWMVAEVSALGIDPGRVAVCGGSVGANLAAALTLRARRHGGPRIAYQQLVVPPLDDRRSTTSSLSSAGTPLLDTEGLAWIWRHYTGTSGRVPALAAPARAADLAGLPPAYIEVAEHDPLRDEGILYALRLMHAGVPVELHQYPGTFHGSAELVPDAAISQWALRRRHAALRAALSRG